MTPKVSLIRLLDPKMCEQCRFAEIMDESDTGWKKRTVRCRRGDCDNWERITPPIDELLRQVLE